MFHFASVAASVFALWANQVNKGVTGWRRAVRVNLCLTVQTKAVADASGTV